MTQIQKRLYNAYQKNGVSAVYKIANKLKLPYSECTQCECDTPTTAKVCGVCGTTK